MSISTVIVPGASAGPAGEHLFVRAARSLGYMTSPLGIESHLSQHGLNLTYETGGCLPWLPDQFVYGRVSNRAFVAAFECKGVARLHDDPMRFLVPGESIGNAYDYMTQYRHWVIYAFVPFNGWDIRVATPSEVETMPRNDWGSYVIDAWRLLTLEQFLSDPPAYIGGYLGRNWPQQQLIAPIQADVPQQPLALPPAA